MRVHICNMIFRFYYHAKDLLYRVPTRRYETLPYVHRNIVSFFFSLILDWSESLFVFQYEKTDQFQYVYIIIYNLYNCVYTCINILYFFHIFSSRNLLHARYQHTHTHIYIYISIYIYILLQLKHLL